MAKRSAADIQRAKEAKQKKVLLALVPVFLLLLVWQGPKTYKSLFAQPAPEATEAPASSTPTATTPVPGAPAVPGAPVPESGLADSDPLPEVGEGRLASLSRFTARDPFDPPPGREEPDEDTTTTPAVPTSAVVEVNGSTESVAPNGSFPAASPVFTVVSVSAEGAVIGLVSGTFESGEETVEIALGEQLTLVADDGTSYSVTLVSVS